MAKRKAQAPQAIPAIDVVQLGHKWHFRTDLEGMPITSTKGYTTRDGALRAARRWLPKVA